MKEDEVVRIIKVFKAGSEIIVFGNNRTKLFDQSHFTKCKSNILKGYF